MKVTRLAENPGVFSSLVSNRVLTIVLTTLVMLVNGGQNGDDHHQYNGHIMGGLVTRYQTKKIKFLDFLCSSNFSSIFFRIFSLIPNNASIQEVV